MGELLSRSSPDFLHRNHTGKLTDTVKKLPQDRILIESEAPFMVPAKYTKRRNKPEYLPETAQAVASIRGVPLEEMSEILYQNSLRAFHITEA